MAYRSDLGLLLVRVLAGGMLAAFHGWGKVKSAYALLVHDQEWRFVHTVASLGFPLPTVFAIAAAIAEFFGGLFLAVGFLTRLAASAIAITMLVAVYRHLTTDWRFELAALYLVIALLFLLGDPGRWALDARLRFRWR
jgi:putative oxidoreductase